MSDPQPKEYLGFDLLVDSDGLVHCFKCHKVLTYKQVAMYVRTAKDDPWTAWCPDCTRYILSAASATLEARALLEDIFR